MLGKLCLLNDRVAKLGNFEIQWRATRKDSFGQAMVCATSFAGSPPWKNQQCISAGLFGGTDRHTGYRTLSDRACHWPGDSATSRSQISTIVRPIYLLFYLVLMCGRPPKSQLSNRRKSIYYLDFQRPYFWWPSKCASVEIRTPQNTFGQFVFSLIIGRQNCSK